MYVPNESIKRREVKRKEKMSKSKIEKQNTWTSTIFLLLFVLMVATFVVLVF